MTTVKLSELTELTTPSSNTEKTFLLVTDTQTGSAVSKKMSVKTLDTLMDVTQGQANLAFNHANSGFNQANAAFIRANNSLSANSGGIVTGDVSITGNLTVTGVTTYTNTQTVLVADNILTLNAAIDQSSAPSLNAGLEIDRGSSANVYLLWNESDDKWTFTEDGTNYDSIGSASTASYANAAFIHANSAFVHTNSAFDAANSASIYANGAFVSVNATIGTVFSVSVYSNSAFDHANSAFNSSNAAFIHANSGFDFANVAANLALSFGATTILEVLNSGSSAYRFTQYGALDNPNVSTFSATTIGFKLNVSGHPFHIRTGDDTADYNTGLVHVSTTGTLSYDSAAQGKVSGTLFWRIPHTAVGNYKYRCANHPVAMLGDINIANTANIYFVHST